MPELSECGLRVNPFEPAASGAPVADEVLHVPEAWATDVRRMLDEMTQGTGVKALVLAGEYGSGKTYLLQWLFRTELPRREIRPFYFDNPGVQFYDLANALLRQVGRKDFAKQLWEFVSPDVSHSQLRLLDDGYEGFIRSHRTRFDKAEAVSALQAAIQRAGISDDEEIAYRLARLVAETPDRPFFEYRDFVAGRPGALVAEGEEAPYFGAILRTLRLAAGTQRVAFLIDEFEEISVGKGLTTRQAHDYLVTIKRLINLTQHENLWLVVAMTPDAKTRMQEIEPALWERFTTQGEYSFQIPPLSAVDAGDLVRNRLRWARQQGYDPPTEMSPFPERLEEALSPATLSSPRRLVKVCFHALSRKMTTPLPFDTGYLSRIEDELYPKPGAAEEQR